ncbi:hypothetical protein ACFLTH_16685 [Bacteroidota bacterium]
MCCSKCKIITGVLLFLLGIVLLLKDLAIWDFWGVSWWTAIIVIAGIVTCCSGFCPMCNESCYKPKEQVPEAEVKVEEQVEEENKE